MVTNFILSVLGNKPYKDRSRTQKLKENISFEEYVELMEYVILLFSQGR